MAERAVGLAGGLGRSSRRSAVRLLAAGVALGAAAWFGAGCEKKEGGSTAAPAKTSAATPAKSGGEAPPASGDSILIGHYASLTGAEATFGRSTDDGIKLAIKEINAAGGVKMGGGSKKLALVSDDTESKAEKAGDVVRKLINKDKVVAVIGEVASSITLEGAPVCQKAKIPTITPSSTNSDVTKVGDYVFRVCFIDPFQGYAGAKFAAEGLKVKKVGMLVDKASAYSDQLSKEFEKAFKKFGGEVIATAEYTKGEKDFNARLTSLREKNPEAIYIPGYYNDIANIAIQARALGIKVPLLGGDGWDSEDLAKNGGDAIEGTFYTNHYAPDQPTPEIQEFVSKYQKEYSGKTPDGLAALGYDATRVLAEAMARAGTTEGSKVRDQIAATKDFKGVTGIITINKDRDAVKPIVVLERKGGKWIFRASITP